MSSYGNDVTRWNLRHVQRLAELLEPVASSSYANRFSPEKCISGVDQCLHIPGKADSAYSSFSGGSNIPECPIPSCYSKNGTPPSEQLPYVDSGFVRSIYNPSAMNSDLGVYQDKSVEMNKSNNLDNLDYDGPFGSTGSRGMLYYSPPSPLARPSPSVPYPPTPLTRADSYKANRNAALPHSKTCFDHSIQVEECIQSTNKLIPFDTPANRADYFLSTCKNESPIQEVDDTWYDTNQYTTKESNSGIFTNPPFIFEDSLKSGSLVKSQKSLCVHNSVDTYKISEGMNSKSFPSPHTSSNAVNDIQENKQYLYSCRVHKPPFAEAAALPSTLSEFRKVNGQRHGVLPVLEVEDHSGMDQGTYESKLRLKYMDSCLLNEAELGPIKTYEDENCCLVSKEENSRSIGQPFLRQQARMQKPSSHGLDIAETNQSEVYDSAIAISHYKHYEDSASEMLSGFRKAKQNDDNNSSPDRLMNPRQEETVKSVHFPKQSFSKTVASQSQDDPATLKINRKTTPLLYYLSGGKNASIMSHKNQAQEQEDCTTKCPRSNHTVSAEPIEISREKNNCVGDTVSKNEVGSPASPVDETFKNDYRERIKIAQRKVLRETSFKRKDLQMSLPIRLKQKPTSRPTIEHLRSWSLSSTNEASKLKPTSRPTTEHLQSWSNEDSKLIPPPRSLENIIAGEESRRPHTIRIGGRKRATKEQKKISYSEPEKLNQLDDQKDQNISWRKEIARSRSDEINDSGTTRSKALENQGRTLSKAELKQIQHNALLQYMERKIGDWPSNAQSSVTLQQRASNLRRFFLEDTTANPSNDKKSLNSNRFCQFPATGRILEHSAYPSSSTSPAASNNRTAGSLVTDMVNLKLQLTVSEGSGDHKASSAQSLVYPGASISRKVRERSKSSPSPDQDFSRSTASPALEAQKHQNYPTYPSSSSKEDLEAVLPDKKETAKQSAYQAGGRGKSMEETRISEMVSLSPLSQSTDQLHSPKRQPVSSGLENSQESQVANQQSALQNRESAPSHAPWQSWTEGVSGLRGSESTVPALEQAHGLGKLNSPCTSLDNPSLGHVPPLPMSGLQSSDRSLESLNATEVPPLAEVDSDVFEVCSTSDSERASNLAFLHGHTKRFIPNREVPDPALTSSAVSISTEGKQIKEQQKASFPAPEREVTVLGIRNGDRREGQDTDLSAVQSKSLQEQRLQDLAMEIIAKDKSLVDILMPQPVRKTTLDLMEGLFPVNVSMLDRACRWRGRSPAVQEKHQSSSGRTTDPSDETENYLGRRVEDRTLHMNQVLSKSRESLNDAENLTSKKKELISNIHLKLQTLWDERELIQSEAKECALHGKELESMVQRCCTPNEFERYMMFIGDLEKVVSLLLCLSSRLARIQNAMEKIDENTDAEEKNSLNERYRLLSRQREDAKDLKENLDRRERVVSGILSKYLSDSQLQDYRHFVQAKTSLLVEQKDLEEQIKFLEEQLERLETSIPPEVTFGPTRFYE